MLERTMNKVNKIGKVLLTCTSLSAILPISVLSSCSNGMTIQLANYESYMDADLIANLESRYDIQFPYYTVAEMIESKFERYYDIAFPCGYEMLSLLRRGWLEKIDWQKFQLSGITDATKAKDLFVPSIIDAMNNQFTDYIKSPVGQDLTKYLDPDGTFNVLNYGIPYFAQSFSFAYKGTPLTFYKYGKEETTISPTWADIFYTVSPSNPHVDERFAPQPGKRLGMVNDAKSVYDISRISETIDDEITNQIPEDNSERRMIQTFDTITDCFEGNKSRFTLNSDSAVISKGLADPKGYAAAFTWSGDTIYAAQGAEEYEVDPQNFHMQEVYGGSLDEIEFLVINNKNSKPELTEKRDKIYEIAKQICLDGAQATSDELAQKEEGHYKYWSMHNFNTILYTPVLNSIYNTIINPSARYWTDKTIEDPRIYSDSSIDIYIKILSQPTRDDVKHLYGRTLSLLENSNTHWAWLQSSNKL